MIEATQKKLREVRYFLAQLEHQANTATLDPSETVEFYLSAFLSAARSVTFVLEAEEPIRYPQWSPVWRELRTEGERKLLTRFTVARNRAVKRETPVVAEDYLASAANDPYKDLPIELRFFLIDEEEDRPVMAHRVLKGRLTPADNEEEIMHLCREYEVLLSQLVAAFLQAHSEPAA